MTINQSLTQRQRTIVGLLNGKMRTPQQVADFLGLSEATINHEMAAAHAVLAEHLARKNRSNRPLARTHAQHIRHAQAAAVTIPDVG